MEGRDVASHTDEFWLYRGDKYPSSIDPSMISLCKCHGENSRINTCTHRGDTPACHGFPTNYFDCFTGRHLHWFLMQQDIKIIINTWKRINGTKTNSPEKLLWLIGLHRCQFILKYMFNYL